MLIERLAAGRPSCAETFSATRHNMLFAGAQSIAAMTFHSASEGRLDLKYRLMPCEKMRRNALKSSP
tara:strand:+ start:251 stop:451 length:201 start_codon:yes stop_codon:yes gene_type:complete